MGQVLNFDKLDKNLLMRHERLIIEQAKQLAVMKREMNRLKDQIRDLKRHNG